MFCLLFFDKMAAFLGDGPMWYGIGMQASTPCNEYWWTNLLYINNFYPTSMNSSVRLMWMKLIFFNDEIAFSEVLGSFDDWSFMCKVFCCFVVLV